MYHQGGCVSGAAALALDDGGPLATGRSRVPSRALHLEWFSGMPQAQVAGLHAGESRPGWQRKAA
jgi:hypothetical protein